MEEECDDAAIRAANNVVLSGQTGNLEGRGAGSRSTVANQGETARASQGNNRADAPPTGGEGGSMDYLCELVPMASTHS